MILKKTTIIVAGGSGTRMNAEIPKQFIELCSKPILMHTIEAFHSYDPAMSIILVIPATQHDFWNKLCLKHQFSIKHELAYGGENRFQSVLNGLNLVEDTGLIAIHDGVRPLVSQNTIKKCFDTAMQLGNAIPTTECIESIRELTSDNNSAVDRSKYRLIQTPQVFESKLLKNAYTQDYSSFFTDDASVVESYFATNDPNKKIHLVEGNRENIKITTPYDLIIAEAIFKK
jgi:2-C-methyl-D-erythritol 4-phosphate cytidylyltransferase